MEFPERSLLICANQRTGSTLLSRAIADTGVAGRPEEYFLTVDGEQFPEFRCWEVGPFATPGMTRSDYLRSVYEQGSTSNGVFAAKLMWNCVDLAAEAFTEVDGFAGLDRRQVFKLAFPDLKAVVLTRRDRLAQAISWARADQANVWVLPTDDTVVFSSIRPPREPEYDGELIGNLLRLIEHFEPQWPDFLDDLGVPQLNLVYEDMVADLAGAVHQVCDHLGIQVDEAVISQIRPRTRRQADDLNDEWKQRFLAESR